MISSADWSWAGCSERSLGLRSGGAACHCRRPCRQARDRLEASVPARPRLPDNPPLDRPLAGRRWADTVGRLGRGSWWSVRRASGRSLEPLPPFSPGRTAVCSNCRRVYKHCCSRASGARQSLEDVGPDAFRSPADKAIIQGLVRPIDRGCIGPAPTSLQNVNDPADHTPVIDAWLASGVRWKVGLKPRKLLLRQPKVIAHRSPLSSEKGESSKARAAQTLYGSRR